MKKLIFLLLVFVLVGCLPSTDILQGGRLAVDLVRYTALEGPSLSIASSEPFDGLPEGCDFVDGEDGIINTQAFCDAPANYEFRTTGKTSAAIVNGFLPVSRPVVVD